MYVCKQHPRLDFPTKELLINHQKECEQTSECIGLQTAKNLNYTVLTGRRHIFDEPNPNRLFQILKERGLSQYISHRRSRGRRHNLDLTPLSLGIETEGGVMTKVVERKTKIPFMAKQTFTTYLDNQPAVTINVYEGERSMTTDNNLLGRLYLHGISLAPSGITQIEVTFVQGVNGILKITAEEKSTGKSHLIQIRNETDRLSQSEIQRMVKEAKRFDKVDRDERERVGERNRLEQYLYQVDSCLYEHQGELPMKWLYCPGVLNVHFKWLDDNQMEKKEEYALQWQRAHEIFDKVMAEFNQNEADGGGDQGEYGGASGSMDPNVTAVLPDMVNRKLRKSTKIQQEG